MISLFDFRILITAAFTWTSITLWEMHHRVFVCFTTRDHNLLSTCLFCSHLQSSTSLDESLLHKNVYELSKNCCLTQNNCEYLLTQLYQPLLLSEITLERSIVFLQQCKWVHRYKSERKVTLESRICAKTKERQKWTLKRKLTISTMRRQRCTTNYAKPPGMMMSRCWRGPANIVKFRNTQLAQGLFILPPSEAEQTQCAICSIETPTATHRTKMVGYRCTLHVIGGTRRRHRFSSNDIPSQWRQ